MEALFRLTDWKYVDCPSAAKGGPHARVSSPVPGRSTLITVAPRSPSSIVAYGPARTREKSATTIPSSAPVTRGLYPIPPAPVRSSGG